MEKLCNQFELFCMKASITFDGIITDFFKKNLLL